MAKALVIGEDTRSFLASVRSLGRKGIEVHVAPGDWTSPALRSRFIAQTHALPVYDLSSEAWLQRLEALQAQEGFDLILPCHDNAIIPLALNRHRFSGVRLGIVNETAFDVFFDKLTTRDLAADEAVPVARGRRLEPGDTADRLIEEFGLPLAVKPRRSFRHDDLSFRRSVKLVHSRTDLAAALGEIDDRDEYFVERIFNGYGVGFSVLADRGRILQAFQHNRVREPLRGGGSSYRESAAPDPALEADVVRLARATDLTGLAMFEFRKRRGSDDYVLLEVNARLWGSVALPIAAGVDFPGLYADMLLAEAERPRIRYRTGVRARHLTNDLNNLVDSLSISLTTRDRRAMADAAVALGGYWRLLAGWDCLDLKSDDDPEPARADLRAFMASVFGRVAQRIGFQRRRARRRTIERISGATSANGEVLTVLSLCRGNICRSPYAALRLAEKARALRMPVKVISAGTQPRIGRPCPGTALVVAAERGVDLSDHRSTHITAHDLAKVDCILHFDPRIEMELRQVCPALPPVVVNLAHLVSPAVPAVSIADPIGRSPEEFRRIYGEIDRALDCFLAMVRARSWPA